MFKFIWGVSATSSTDDNDRWMIALKMLYNDPVHVCSVSTATHSRVDQYTKLNKIDMITSTTHTHAHATPDAKQHKIKWPKK